MNKEAVTIIGGADGPTSIFVAGRKKGVPIKHRIKNRIYKWKGKRAAKKIIAGERTLAEVVAYAVEKYHAAEADITRRKYAAQKNCLKESLISRYKPELLGELAEPARPDEFTPDTVKAMQEQFLARRKMVWGVSEEDIRQKSERYHSLLATLSI